MPPRGLRLPVSRKLCIGTDRLRSVSRGEKWCRRDVLEINTHEPKNHSRKFLFIILIVIRTEQILANIADIDVAEKQLIQKRWNLVMRKYIPTSLHIFNKSIGFTHLFHSEKYLNLPFPIHSFRDSAGVAQRGGCFQKGFDRNVSELGRGSLRCLCCLSRGGLSVRMCMPEKASGFDSFSGIHIRADCTTFEKRQK